MNESIKKIIISKFLISLFLYLKDFIYLAVLTLLSHEPLLIWPGATFTLSFRIGNNFTDLFKLILKGQQNESKLVLGFSLFE